MKFAVRLPEIVIEVADHERTTLIERGFLTHDGAPTRMLLVILTDAVHRAAKKPVAG